jgi:hypothetical protein
VITVGALLEQSYDSNVAISVGGYSFSSGEPLAFISSPSTYNGSYVFYYTPPEVGTYAIEVYVNKYGQSIPVSGNPFTVEVKGMHLTIQNTNIKKYI